MITRDALASLCAMFPRLDYAEPSHSLKRAAVAIVVVERAPPHHSPALLLTRRTHRLSSHGGQFALPGGRIDEGEDVVGAALREAFEELGLQLARESVIGVLDDYPTRSGYLITPVVVWGGVDPDLEPNPHEVARLHFVPLADIVRPEAVEFISIPESERLVVRLQMDGNKVHAPTAALVYQFAELLCGRITRVAELEQPVFAWR